MNSKPNYDVTLSLAVYLEWMEKKTDAEIFKAILLTTIKFNVQ